MVSTGLSFNQYNAEGTEKEDCFRIRPSFSRTCPGSLAPSASFDAVCIMNMILNSAVLPRITSKHTIAKWLLDILPFLFHLVMAIEYLSDDRRRNFKNYISDSSSRRQQIIPRRYSKNSKFHSKASAAKLPLQYSGTIYRPYGFHTVFTCLQDDPSIKQNLLYKGHSSVQCFGAKNRKIPCNIESVVD